MGRPCTVGGATRQPNHNDLQRIYGGLQLGAHNPTAIDVDPDYQEIFKGPLDSPPSTTAKNFSSGLPCNGSVGKPVNCGCRAGSCPEPLKQNPGAKLLATRL